MTTKLDVSADLLAIAKESEALIMGLYGEPPQIRNLVAERMTAPFMSMAWDTLIKIRAVKAKLEAAD
jgi:hypothetical protein